MGGLTPSVAVQDKKQTNEHKMRIKTGVNMCGLKLPMRVVMQEAEHIWKKHGQELVITSALDGEHMAGSWHYFGLALDLRTRYFPEALRIDIAAQLRHALGPGYTVLNHSTHIHVEYQT